MMFERVGIIEILLYDVDISTESKQMALLHQASNVPRNDKDITVHHNGKCGKFQANTVNEMLKILEQGSNIVKVACLLCMHAS
jgi:hypothetical protein